MSFQRMEKLRPNFRSIFQNIFTEQPYIISGSMKRHQQTTQISLKECFPQASYEVDGLWNEFNHQQVFSLYEPRFAKPELLKQDVFKEVDPRAYLAQIFDEAIARWTMKHFIMNMMNLGQHLKLEWKQHLKICV